MISLNLKPENWENKTIILSSQVKYYNSFYHKSQKVSLYMMIYDSLLVLCLVTQLCLTLCEPMDCSLPGSSVHGNSPGKNTEVGCHALLQGIFQTQGSNLDIPHCRQILYRLSHTQSYVVIFWVSEPGSFLLPVYASFLHCCKQGFKKDTID